MFFAAKNNAIIGYAIDLVAFESKKKRNEFVKRTDFSSVTVKEAEKHGAYKDARNYPESIFNESRKMRGVVLFTYAGEFSRIA